MVGRWWCFIFYFLSISSQNCCCVALGIWSTVSSSSKRIKGEVLLDHDFWLINNNRRIRDCQSDVLWLLLNGKQEHDQIWSTWKQDCYYSHKITALKFTEKGCQAEELALSLFWWRPFINFGKVVKEDYDHRKKVLELTFADLGYRYYSYSCWRRKNNNKFD